MIKHSLILICYTLLGALLLGNAHPSSALAVQRTTSLAHFEGRTSKENVLPEGIIVISISGSTNSCAQALFVRSTGSVTYISCHSRKYVLLPSNLTNAFFEDIHQAEPLNALPSNKECLKSASFGNTIFLALKTQESPDVSCSIDHLGQILHRDVGAIQSLVYAASAAS